MSKLKQCAVCKGHYDNSMLVGIMDTFMCNVCGLELDSMMKTELGEDYKKNLTRTSTRHIEDKKPVLTVYSPVHPKVDMEPTTA